MAAKQPPKNVKVLAILRLLKNGEIPLTFILVVVLFLGQQIYEGIALHDNVSQITHIIGGAIGGFVGYFFNRK